MNIDLKLQVIRLLKGYSFASNIRLDSDDWLVDGVAFITLSQVRREDFLKELKELICSWDKRFGFDYIEIDNGVYDCLVFEKEENDAKNTETEELTEELTEDEKVIAQMLIEKDQENIEQGKRRLEMLDWLSKTPYVKNGIYTPPFVQAEYLKWLETANIWSPIPEFPSYEINSSTGDVRDIVTKLEPYKITNAGGKVYYYLKNKQLYGDTEKMKARAYLLAITFIVNPDVINYNQVHYIKDKNVDKLTNLVWSNQSEATKKNFAKGMHKAKQLTDQEKAEIEELVLSGAPYSYGKLARKYGVHSFIISTFIKGITEIQKAKLEASQNIE